MIVCLPLLSFIFIFLLFLRLQNADDDDLRPSFLAAALAWSALAVVGTEGLSLATALTRLSLAIFWGLVMCASATAAFAGPFPRRSKTQPLPRLFSVLDPSSLFLYGCLLGVLILTGLTAWMAPPNTWDSMTYHMSRVAHWRQNHSVDFYPTAIIRQLVYPPGAEYLILHFQILSQSDRWANLIQWFALLGGMTGTSLLAKCFKADAKTQLLTALLTASLPTAILQSSSTQNDLVVSFWLVCLVYWGWTAAQSSRRTPAVLAGLALGLTLLTKGTGLLFAVVPLLWLTMRNWMKNKFKTFLHIAVMVFLAAALNLPFWLRLQDWTSRAPRLDTPEWNLTVHEFHPSLLAANILRNAGLHLATPLPTLNARLEHIVYAGTERLNIPLNDPRISFGDHEFHILDHPFHEDNAGNTLHLLLILATAAGLVLFFRWWPQGLAAFFGCLVLNAVLFCLLLKWQPWHSRLHLPLFILAMPAVAVVIARLSRRLLLAIGVLLFLAAVPWLLFNESRPLVGEKNIFRTGRESQYFANNPGFEHSYRTAVQAIAGKGCTQVGLSMNGDGWEYPLWPLFAETTSGRFRFEHLDVNNASSQFVPQWLADFVPCAILDDGQQQTLTLSFKGQQYVRMREWAFLSLYSKDETGGLYGQAFVFYFNRLLSLAAAAAQTSRPDELSALREQELNTARLFNGEELNRLYPSLGGEITVYKKALAQWREAYARHDQGSLTVAHKKIIGWYRWLIEHQAALSASLKTLRKF